MRVPDDVSVVGFDDIYFSRIAVPPLTTVGLSRERLGKLALEALQKCFAIRSGRGRSTL